MGPSCKACDCHAKNWWPTIKLSQSDQSSGTYHSSCSLQSSHPNQEPVASLIVPSFGYLDIVLCLVLPPGTIWSWFIMLTITSWHVGLMHFLITSAIQMNTIDALGCMSVASPIYTILRMVANRACKLAEDGKWPRCSHRHNILFISGVIYSIWGIWKAPFKVH